jgi:hypothetical protein
MVFARAGDVTPSDILCNYMVHAPNRTVFSQSLRSYWPVCPGRMCVCVGGSSNTLTIKVFLRRRTEQHLYAQPTTHDAQQTCTNLLSSRLHPKQAAQAHLPQAHPALPLEHDPPGSSRYHCQLPTSTPQRGPATSTAFRHHNYRLTQH